MKIYGITSDGNVTVSGSLFVSGSITGSDNIVHALTASNAVSSSYAVSASFLIGGGTFDSSGLVTTASFNAYTGSVSSQFAGTASFASTASFITGSGVIGTVASSSYALSSSYATFAETASSATNAQDILVYVLNNSGYDIAKGVVVHITASGNSSDIPRIVTASYENDANSANTLGITNQAVPHTSGGYVMTEGVLKGINTSNFQSGQLIYLGATGSIIGSAPQAPLHGVRLGQVVREQTNNGSIYVSINNGYEIDELHDVRITTALLSYGDLLMRSGSVWINSKQLSGSYGLTGSLNVNGSITGSFTGSLTGSLFGTASFSTSSSFAISASFSTSSSFATSASFGTSSSFSTSSSFASTASFALNAGGAGFPFTGSAQITGSLGVTGSVGITQNLSVVQNITGSRMFLSASSNMNSGSTLYIYGSGSTQPVFTVQGSQGELFSVTDQLSGSLFSVNDISGLPILETFSDNTILMGSYLAPALNTTARNTITSAGSFTVYGLPTASYDGAWFEYVARSGSNSRAGTIMAVWSGSAVNFTETTTTDFGTTTGLSFIVAVTGSNFALTGSATTAGWTVKTIVRSI